MSHDQSEPDKGQQQHTTAETISSFWVSSYPYFHSTLFVSPVLDREPEGPTTLSFYDADGGCFNKTTMVFPRGEVGAVDLEPFMGSCKVESGLKHARLVVKSPAGMVHSCRFVSADGAVFSGTPSELEGGGTFMPVLFRPEADPLLVVLNNGRNDSQAKIKLYLGKRTPELKVKVPAGGVRLLPLNALANEYLDLGKMGSIQAYARISAKQGAHFGVQLVEAIEVRGATSVIGTVS